MDHIVGNTFNMKEAVDRIKKWLGFHTFAFFTKEDIQTEWTSLNSEVLANDFDTILMPINEPAPKKRESQIEEYLKANNGAGVQHIALFTNDVLSSIGAPPLLSPLPLHLFFPPSTHIPFRDDAPGLPPRWLRVHPHPCRLLQRP